jgi:hypothetical protein
MSTIQLPTRGNPVEATRIGPKILVLYSLPKVGKTKELVNLAEMQDCLILDAEEGTETYTTTKLTIRSTTDIAQAISAVFAEGSKRMQAGIKGKDAFPYQFIAIDTLDKLEEYAEATATLKYRNGPMNKNKKFEERGFTTITELPDGNGYQYLRKEVMDNIELVASACPYLILIVHVKEKLMLDKSNQEVKVNDISLTGKLASMVCAKADGIGYMYRTDKGELRISFQTYDGAIMGARQRYLAGKDFPFDWKLIYPEAFGLDIPEIPAKS